MRLGSHPIARRDRARAAFIELRGEADAAVRAAEIAALETKDWKGVQVFEVTCHGTTGRGPHKQFILEQVLWALIEIEAFICPHHRN